MKHEKLLQGTDGTIVLQQTILPLSQSWSTTRSTRATTSYPSMKAQKEVRMSRKKR